MASRKTKTIIGIFVLGAIGFICAAMIFLGSGSFNRNTASFVLYFKSSVRGLTDGAAVYFNGVRIGQVVSMGITSSKNSLNFQTPVIIELDIQKKAGNVQTGGSELVEDMNDPKKIQSLIKNGLRAKLTTSSFITGLLVIDLAMIPNATPVDQGSLEPYHGITQIPTVASGIDSMLTKFATLPVQDIATETLHTLENINKVLNDIQFVAISNDLQKIMATLDKTLIEYSKIANSLNKNVDSLLNKTNAALSSVDKMAKNGSSILQTNSATMQELSQTMFAIREAAISISHLAKLLEEKPDALIFGKGR